MAACCCDAVAPAVSVATRGPIKRGGGAGGRFPQHAADAANVKRILSGVCLPS